jgi:hypothetical protein
MSDPTPVPGAEPGDGGVIIIKGGSCEIHFDENVFKHDPTEKNRRTHKDKKMNIVQIAVTGEKAFNFPKGFTGEIKITCRPKP